MISLTSARCKVAVLIGLGGALGAKIKYPAVMIMSKMGIQIFLGSLQNLRILSSFIRTYHSKLSSSLHEKWLWSNEGNESDDRICARNDKNDKIPS